MTKVSSVMSLSRHHIKVFFLINILASQPAGPSPNKRHPGEKVLAAAERRRWNDAAEEEILVPFGPFMRTSCCTDNKTDLMQKLLPSQSLQMQTCSSDLNTNVWILLKAMSIWLWLDIWSVWPLLCLFSVIMEDNQVILNKKKKAWASPSSEYQFFTVILSRSQFVLLFLYTQHLKSPPKGLGLLLQYVDHLSPPWSFVLSVLVSFGWMWVEIIAWDIPEFILLFCQQSLHQ